jgi:hypothetical protein
MSLTPSDARVRLEVAFIDGEELPRLELEELLEIAGYGTSPSIMSLWTPVGATTTYSVPGYGAWEQKPPDMEKMLLRHEIRQLEDKLAELEKRMGLEMLNGRA